MASDARVCSSQAPPARFTLPQFGIFPQGTHAHHFLEFDLKPGVSHAMRWRRSGGFAPATCPS